MPFEQKMALAGVLLFVLGVVLALKLVPPNSVIGVRTAKTRSSLDVWYTANRSVGITLGIVGIVIVATTLVVPLLMPDYSEGVRVLVIGTILIFTIVIMAARSFGKSPNCSRKQFSSDQSAGRSFCNRPPNDRDRSCSSRSLAFQRDSRKRKKPAAPGGRLLGDATG